MHQPAAIDTGAAGPAAVARARVTETVALEYRATGPVQAEVTRIAAPHLIDRMHVAAQLSDRQWEAARLVLAKHDAAGFEPRVTGSYSPRGWNHGHDDDAAEARAITDFRDLLGGASAADAWLLHGLCLEQHPGVRWLASLQAALERLADMWGLER